MSYIDIMGYHWSKQYNSRSQIQTVHELFPIKCSESLFRSERKVPVWNNLERDIIDFDKLQASLINCDMSKYVTSSHRLVHCSKLYHFISSMCSVCFSLILMHFLIIIDVNVFYFILFLFFSFLLVK